MARHGKFGIEWISTLEGIGSLEPLWRELESTVHDRSVHSRFDWVYPWYQHFANEAKPRYGLPLLGVATIGNNVAGLAPFVSRRIKLSGIGLRCAELVGFNAQTGEMLISDSRPTLVGEFVRSLLSCGDFDVVRMNGFSEGTDRLDSVRKVTGKRQLELLDYYYPVVDLEQGCDHYFESRSNRFRRTLRRQIRMANQDFGGWELERNRTDTDERSVAAMMDRMTSIYNSSWKAVANSEPLPRDYIRFYADIAQRFGANGELDLSILRLGEQDAAFFLALKDRDILYDVFISYDQQFKALRPGEFLVKQLLPRIADDNCKLLVSHGAHEYKKVWSTGEVPQLRLLAFAKSLRAFAGQPFGFKFRRLIRRITLFARRLSLPSFKPARLAALRVLRSLKSTFRNSRL